MTVLFSLNKMQRRIAPISSKKSIKLTYWKYRIQPSVAGLLNQCQTQQHMKEWRTVQTTEQGRYFWWHLDAFNLLYKQGFWGQQTLNHMCLEYLQKQKKNVCSQGYLILSFQRAFSLRRHTIIGGYIISLLLKLFFCVLSHIFLMSLRVR